ncbi:TIGR03086 family protein [Candidatus Parcubacteria bacterium]|nr:TIGR03086 family protein [Candidatus Parcubacteria bacterium]
MNLFVLHWLASQEFDRGVTRITDDQWSLPTPCTEWDVRQLVRHLVYEQLWVPPLIEGQTIEQVGDRFVGDVLGDDPKLAWKTASTAATVALRQEGAMSRKVHLSFGDVVGREYTWQLFIDLLIHAWDLARALGVDENLDPELVEAGLQKMQVDAKDWRAAGVLGEELAAPDGADAQTRLLALMGRKS